MSIIIEDKFNDTSDAGFSVNNFYSGRAPRLIGPPRFSGNVNQIIVHESVTTNLPRTIDVLRKRKLGVHFIIDPAGAITQHGDLVHDALSHAGSHNSVAVGIEIVNPYYPRHLSKGPWALGTWREVISARWAHERKYVVPVLPQLEALSQLLTFLTQTKTDRFDVPWRLVGWSPDKGRFSMSRVSGTKWSKKPGIYAHTAFAHADGAFPLLYCLIREGSPLLKVEEVRELAMRKASETWWSWANGWYADLDEVLR